MNCPVRLARYLCHCCGAESYAAIGKAALGENSTALVNACVLGNGLIALVPRREQSTGV